MPTTPCCLPSTQEIGCFTRKELRYFAQYLNWVGQTVGACLGCGGMLQPSWMLSQGSKEHPS